MRSTDMTAVSVLYRASFLNGKMYHGVTRNFKRRKAEHLSIARTGKKRSAFHRAIKKYGAENVRWEILAVGQFWYIQELERKAVAAFNSKIPSGYNQSDGGDVPPVILGPRGPRPDMVGDLNPAKRPENRAKIAQSKIGLTHTPESKAKMAAAHRGKYFGPSRKGSRWVTNGIISKQIWDGVVPEGWRFGRDDGHKATQSRNTIRQWKELKKITPRSSHLKSIKGNLSKEERPMKRFADILRDGEWIGSTMMDIKSGECFRLYEPDGAFICEATADRDAYLNAEGIMTIEFTPEAIAA